jgi:hypothetical protein
MSPMLNNTKDLDPYASPYQKLFKCNSNLVLKHVLLRPIAKQNAREHRHMIPCKLDIMPTDPKKQMSAVVSSCKTADVEKLCRVPPGLVETSPRQA